MKIKGPIKESFLQSTYGGFATAVFLVCAFSGVLLAVPYDVSSPYASVSHLILTNPWADFTRNMHYWSAQAFLVLGLLHVWDHLKKNMLKRLSAGLWLRLCISLFFIFFVMLTGYFLKGDLEGMEARQILTGLLEKIPFIGAVSASVLLGRGQSLQLVYVHHIATATIFLTIIIIEHAGTLWTRLNTLLVSVSILILFSLFLRAPMHDGMNPVVKGPWYFLGFQEMLHWLSMPQLALLFFFIILGSIFLMRWLHGPSYSGVLWLVRISTGIYILLTLTGVFFRGENWEFRTPWKWANQHHITLPYPDKVFASEIPSEAITSGHFKPVLGRYESCLACHPGMTGLSASHDPAVIGCVSCHQGNPLAVTKTAAHKGMSLVPGNLSDAGLSCGTQSCHPAITGRIHTSLMTTVSGMISVDKWVFGEFPTPDQLSSPADIKHSPADEHLSNLCLGCHLGQDKKIPGPPDELSKGGGCNACHLVYDKPTAAAIKAYYASKDPLKTLPAVHPNLSVHVTDDKCFSCHNRSGRIATSYEGLFETQRNTSAFGDLWAYKVVDGHRVFELKEDDIHHRGGMSCIDCHNSYELMGDGKQYRHKEEAVNTRCEDCHTSKPQVQRGISGIDAESGKILGLNSFLKDNTNFIKNAQSGRIYVNTRVPITGNPRLITKNTGKNLEMKPPNAVCLSSTAHKTLSCVSCHALRAPTCIGCHNEYKSSVQGYDQVLQKEITGTWVESVGTYDARPPTLGIREDGKGNREVIPFVPGMVMTIDMSTTSHGKQKPTVFHRLFAPIDPHNTAAKGRSCISCHNDPSALGYGEGELTYLPLHGKGKWVFTSRYEINKNDGLPEDAWFGFLKERKDQASTRTGYRPFNMQEQQRILRVGACLTCHDQDTGIMKDALIDFKKVLAARTRSCSTPAF